MKLKVLYFTNLRIDTDMNGGYICCRNHIKRLSEDSGIELFVMAAQHSMYEKDSLNYFLSNGISGKFIAHNLKSDRSKLSLIKKLIPVTWEEFASHQYHIDSAIIETMQEMGTDLLLIEYLHTTSICPLAIKKAPRVAVITLNRETEYYSDYLKSIRKGWFKRIVKTARMWQLEQSVFRAMDKIIALSPPDVPKRKGAYITPYLDRNPEPWKPNASRTLLFVGNIVHYPNAKAIEYIVKQLAPAMAQIMPDVRFKIIGASKEDLTYHHPSRL